MAKDLLSVRIPSELMDRISGIAAETRRDKTSVAVELLQRGLNTVTTQPMESDNFVSTEKFEAAIAQVRSEVLGLVACELQALKRSGAAELPPMLNGSAGQ